MEIYLGPMNIQRMPLKFSLFLVRKCIKGFVRNIRYFGRKLSNILIFVSILSFRRVLYVVCFLLGISPASEV